MTSPTHPRPNYGGIFVSLFVLTIVEIFVANLGLHKLTIILVLVGLAIVKASLVAMFYMHLRFEKILLTLFALAPLIFSVILTLMVGFDVPHHHFVP